MRGATYLKSDESHFRALFFSQYAFVMKLLPEVNIAGLPILLTSSSKHKLKDGLRSKCLERLCLLIFLFIMTKNNDVVPNNDETSGKVESPFKPIHDNEFADSVFKDACKTKWLEGLENIDVL